MQKLLIFKKSVHYKVEKDLIEKGGEKLNSKVWKTSSDYTIDESLLPYFLVTGFIEIVPENDQLKVIQDK